MQDLPALPEGWSYQQGSPGDYIVHVVWPEHGAMSIDFKHRTMTGSDPREKKNFMGNGWKAALVAEAVKRLRAAWA
jgi:hypothetical protein